MNIALFSSDLKTVETNQLDFILELIQAGHSPMVYVLNDDSESALFNKIKVRVVNVDYLFEDVCQLRSFAPINKLAEQFDSFAIDILVCSSATACIYGALAGRKAGVKKVYTQFTDLGRLLQTNKKMRKVHIKNLCKDAAKKSDKVIFHNMDDMMFFVNNGLVENEKAVLIGGYGINTEEFAKSEYKNTREFFMAAPLAVDKGVWEYIQAASIIKQLKRDCTFKLLIKPDYSSYGIDKSEILPYGEEGYVEIVEGYDENIEQLMESCACFVIPSYHESMPFELLLAMAKGRPVIASNVPGCRDAVIDGANGYIVPPQNVADLVKIMLEMIENNDTAAQMAEESYNMCIQKYDAYHVCEKLMSIIFAPDPQPEEEEIADEAAVDEESVEEKTEETEVLEDTAGDEE